jgi:hypothetical protein
MKKLRLLKKAEKEEKKPFLKPVCLPILIENVPEHLDFCYVKD